METKTLCQYEVELNDILEVMKESYKDPISFALRKSEQVLIKKIDELEEVYHKTNQNSYKEVIDRTLKKYNKIIKEGVTAHSNFVSLRNFPDEKAVHPNFEERIRRKNAGLEIVIMDYENSGKNVARF